MLGPLLIVTAARNCESTPPMMYRPLASCLGSSIAQLSLANCPIFSHDPLLLSRNASSLRLRNCTLSVPVPKREGNAHSSPLLTKKLPWLRRSGLDGPSGSGAMTDTLDHVWPPSDETCPRIR